MQARGEDEKNSSLSKEERREGGREEGKEGRKDVSRCLKLFSKEVKLTREMLSGHARKP